MMSQLRWYLTLFGQYSAQYLKSKLVYRTDLLFYLTSDFLMQVVNLIFILVMFRQVPSIVGWTKYELLFIYGFFTLPSSIYSGLCSGLFEVPEKYVLQGELDRILVRPVNSLFQILLETMELELLLGMIPGLIIMGYSGYHLQLQWQWWHYPLLLVLTAGATLVYAGIYILLASLGFFFEGTTALMPMVYNLSTYGRFPIGVYKGMVKWILTWLLPFAFVGFYPATILMNKFIYWKMALLTPVMGLVVLGVGYLFWHRGVTRYMGTGS